MELVRGPSAVTGDWGRFFRLTWVIAKKDYKLSYFGSVLGYVWSLMQPLLFFGVLYLVFAVIVQFNKGVKDFPVLLLMNIVLFGFFQQATGASIMSVMVRENLVRKMDFPRLVIPIATVVTQAINLAFNLSVVVIFMLLYGVAPRLTWLLLPALVLWLFVITTGLAMLLSALYVRFRDVAPIWGVISQALYFASPVFIVIDSVLVHGRTVARYYLFNPAGHDPSAGAPLDDRRWCGRREPVDDHGLQGVAARPGGDHSGLFLLGLWVFAREAPRIAEEL